MMRPSPSARCRRDVSLPSGKVRRLDTRAAVALLLLTLSATCLPSCDAAQDKQEAVRIAVIGGGISGSFVTKYLMEYDGDACDIDSLTIFDPMPSLGASHNDMRDFDRSHEEGGKQRRWQESRLSAVHIPNSGRDGGITTVEIGASIMYKAFRYALEMIEGDEALQIVKPFTTSTEVKPDVGDRPDGMGIYEGDHDFATLSTGMSKDETKSLLMKRYHLDLYAVDKAAAAAEAAFGRLHDLIDDPTRKAFRSPREMWETVDVWQNIVTKSLDEVCDDLGLLSRNGTVSLIKSLPQWIAHQMAQLFFGVDKHAALRDELLGAINIVNYHQNLTQINGIAGLGSFSATTGGLFALAGGNSNLISSAFKQAKQHRQQTCSQKADIISHKSNRVATVIGSHSGFEVYDDASDLMGVYDVVILAAPYSMAQIEFLIHSHVDDSVLMPMPMGDLIQHADSEGRSKIPTDDSHVGFDVLPKPLPHGVTRPYTQVVTTVVKDGKLQAGQFGLEQDQLPRSILMTPKGKPAENDIASIAWLADGVYKIFSSQPLSIELLQKYFGPSVQVAAEKVWGGPHGGATPDYQGTATDVNFLMYDGADGLHGHTKSGALYYPNAMELTFACIELSAVGAKAVAKLVAQRFGWITPDSDRDDMAEEL